MDGHVPPDDHLLEEARRQGINRLVVAAVISENSRVLLLRRPESDFMPDIYEFPSGRVEEGESLDAALFREVEEETGLKITRIESYTGYFDYRSKSGSATRQFNFVVTVAVPLEIRLREHDHFAWAGGDELEKYPVTEEVRQVIEVFLAGEAS
ncbi:MAG: NUDIX domain-containing protein [Dehalococcoidia bacterium]